MCANCLPLLLNIGDAVLTPPVLYLQNFNVILTQHNPARDKNVHFIVQPKMSAKDRQLIAQRKVRPRLMCCNQLLLVFATDVRTMTTTWAVLTSLLAVAALSRK